MPPSSETSPPPSLRQLFIHFCGLTCLIAESRDHFSFETTIILLPFNPVISKLCGYLRLQVPGVSDNIEAPEGNKSLKKTVNPLQQSRVRTNSVSVQNGWTITFACEVLFVLVLVFVEAYNHGVTTDKTMFWYSSVGQSTAEQLYTGSPPQHNRERPKASLTFMTSFFFWNG